MENKNENHQLITIKNKYTSKTMENKKFQSRTKKIKLSLNNKKQNTSHKITKSHRNLSTNKINKKQNKINDSNTNYFLDKSAKIKKQEAQLKKLETIDLIEKNTKNIYDWNILLNNPNLGLYYKKKEYKNLEIDPQIKDQNSKQSNRTIVLVDLTESQVKKYFGKKSNNIKGRNLKYVVKNKNNSNSPLNTLNSNEESKKSKFSQKRALTETMNEINDKNIISNNIRPRSIYSVRKPEEIFYFSNDFSDYYKEDLKTFCEKMPLLKARINTCNKKLKQEIIRQRIKSSKEEIKLNEIINNIKTDSIKFKKLDLIIAGERKNAEPLLRNTYYQENPHLKKVNEHIKMYYKTMKPYGNNKGNIDYTKNERWRPSYEIKNLREKHQQKQYSNVGTSMDNFDLNDNYYGKNFNKKPKLILSYYNNDDPDIKYFNFLVNKYNNNRTISSNNEINNDFNTINDKIKENIYLSNFHINDDKNNQKEIASKEFSRFPFIIEQYQKYNKENNLERKKYNIDNNTYQDHKYFVTETTKNTINEY